jgi:thiol-disulfide isomerase/thioredoxin
MRLLRLSNILRRRGFGPSAVFLFAFLLLCIPLITQAGPNAHVKILYYFSMSCRHCFDAKPAVVALSKEFTVEGQNVGDSDATGYPFPVRPGDKKKSKEEYGVKGVPTLVVFIDNERKQNIAGAQDIGDAKFIIKALAKGAKTVTEAVEKKPTGDITLTGWVSAKGEYFKNAQFFITDRKTEVLVRPWLPLEAMRSMARNNKPRLMSDVVRRPVMLRGSMTASANGYLFQVKEELPID